jgi:hypothetical protein
MAAVTYPGVYIEELPSGVRTITGVSTSVTAFVGWAPKGPATPTQITSFGEYDRIFGGLSAQSLMSFAVRQYFLNGGQTAVIVRVFGDVRSALAGAITAAATTVTVRAGDGALFPTTFPYDIVIEAETLRVTARTSDALTVTRAAGGTTAAAHADGAVVELQTKARLRVPGSTGPLTLDASSPGLWGNNLRVETDTANVSSPGLFNIIVSDPGPPEGAGTGASEIIRNLSADSTSPRFISPILERQSQFLRVAPGTTPHLPIGTRGARSTLAGTITAAATSLSVQAGDGARFPSTFPYKVTVEAEILQVTARTDESLTVTRGADGTTAVQHADGTAVELQPIGVATIGSDGGALGATDVVPASGGATSKLGMYALEDQDIFNILVIPPLAFGKDVPAEVWAAAATYCRTRRAFLIVDAPSAEIVAPVTTAKAGFGTLAATLSPGTLDAQYAGYFFPRVRAINPLTGVPQEFAPSGAIAGIFARTDASRGVWKAPAGLEAGINGILELTYNVTDGENGVLNQVGVNCLRTFNLMGSVVWGSRTVQGSDALASDWKYIPVRRLALYIEESLFRGTQWVVFEPNDEPLWAQIRLAIGAFMQNLFRQGAFQGRTPREAYFVKCDGETTTQNDINLGIVNILVGFAPLKPAEFVVIKIQQIAGQVQT